jgi:glycine/D-amino acid oxidase-like deaminating enzyme/nitrite reductase/ring-hydroxylating ferredoxin subunit
MSASEAKKQLSSEYRAVRSVGAAVDRVSGVPLHGLGRTKALRYRRQATFHPLRYLRALALEIQKLGGSLHANCAVTSIEENRDHVVLKTAHGDLQADIAVVATNSPIIDRFPLHTSMAPYRTYAMAFSVSRGTVPDALYWDMADPYHYLRIQPGPGRSDYVIVGGADHKTGEADDATFRFEHVEAWARKLIPRLGPEVTRWSGQVMDTVDYCAFIGRNPGSKRTYVVTGDSGQGMTHGALAGILVKELITSGDSPWTGVYDPSRVSLMGLKNFVRENVSVVKNLSEHLMPGEIKSTDELRPGDGAILRKGVSRIAVSRGADGKLIGCSAVCTHLGCNVHWNTLEQCWDCSCHGSHFARDGSVLNGPAVKPLPRKSL